MHSNHCSTVSGSHVGSHRRLLGPEQRPGDGLRGRAPAALQQSQPFEHHPVVKLAKGAGERLVVQTSEGRVGDPFKLQVAATPVMSVEVPVPDALPSAQPRDCSPDR